MDKYIKKRNLHTVLQIVLFLVLVAIDRITKIIAVNNLMGKEPVPVIKDIIEFKYLENSGAAFGSLENAFWLFYVLTVVVFIIILFIWIKLNKELKKYAGLNESNPAFFKVKTFNDIEYLGYLLAALAAGAIGNFIDRISTQYVVDFIYFKFINFPVFNFADICVTVSVVLICILLLFTYKEDKNFKLFAKKKKEKRGWERYTVENSEKNENATENDSCKPDFSVPEKKEE